jgi:hypothetical protein
MVAVRWYLRYGLSYRDAEELLAERSIAVDHVTVYRWVQRITPLLIDAARAQPAPCNAPRRACGSVDLSVTTGACRACFATYGKTTSLVAPGLLRWRVAGRHR